MSTSTKFFEYNNQQNPLTNLYSFYHEKLQRKVTFYDLVLYVKLLCASTPSELMYSQNITNFVSGSRNQTEFVESKGANYFYHRQRLLQHLIIDPQSHYHSLFYNAFDIAFGTGDLALKLLVSNDPSAHSLVKTLLISKIQNCAEVYKLLSQMSRSLIVCIVEDQDQDAKTNILADYYLWIGVGRQQERGHNVLGRLYSEICCEFFPTISKGALRDHMTQTQHILQQTASQFNKTEAIHTIAMQKIFEFLHIKFEDEDDEDEEDDEISLYWEPNLKRR